MADQRAGVTLDALGQPDFIQRDFHAGSVETMISSYSAGCRSPRRPQRIRIAGDRSGDVEAGIAQTCRQRLGLLAAIRDPAQRTISVNVPGLRESGAQRLVQSRRQGGAVCYDQDVGLSRQSFPPRTRVTSSAEPRVDPALKECPEREL